jgi:hypothetical protein
MPRVVVVCTLLGYVAEGTIAICRLPSTRFVSLLVVDRSRRERWQLNTCSGRRRSRVCFGRASAISISLARFSFSSLSSTLVDVVILIPKRPPSIPALWIRGQGFHAENSWKPFTSYASYRQQQQGGRESQGRKAQPEPSLCSGSAWAMGVNLEKRPKAEFQETAGGAGVTLAPLGAPSRHSSPPQKPYRVTPAALTNEARSP